MISSIKDAFADFLETAEVDPSLKSGTFEDNSEPDAERGPGRRPIGDRAMTQRERSRKKDIATAEMRKRNIAILDMETDPFDNINKTSVYPFLAVLYSDQFETVIIWEENYDALVRKIVGAIEALPQPFTIYAHNGGRFDFLFLLRSIRGHVSFKGRGIMSASIGKHSLRDSFHIIPERLANIQKDTFDYNDMQKNRRAARRGDIIRYCISDCAYLFPIVKAFINEFGLKLSIGQAAIAEVRKTVKVKRFTEGWDSYVRQYYYGGRVDCINGRGRFDGAYKLYDINSSYPNVMANFMHPIGDFHDYVLRAGIPSNDTCFIDLDCDNRGALIGRDADGETTSQIAHGRFFTTIHEFEVACKYNLISNVKINYCLDCRERSNFRDFVMPLYTRRQAVKAELFLLKEAGNDHGQYWHDLRKDDIFLKLLLNNCYGKFGQNPRLFKEHYLTDPDQLPPPEWFESINKKDKRNNYILSEDERALYNGAHFESNLYWIWVKPAPRFHYNNVGVAASVTGAARAVLLEALQHAVDPIYCDTDSIICRDLNHVHIHKTELGAWDLEDEYTKVIIDGKKLYAVWHKEPKKRTREELALGLVPEYTVKSKGTAGLTWQNMAEMLDGNSFAMTNRAPTLTRYGTQNYITRQIRATARAL
jgi:DNA polymerase type B, organellar and viral